MFVCLSNIWPWNPWKVLVHSLLLHGIIIKHLWLFGRQPHAPRPFNVSQGVRHGALPSPLLYVIYLNDLYSQSCSTCSSIEIWIDHIYILDVLRALMISYTFAWLFLKHTCNIILLNISSKCATPKNQMLRSLHGWLPPGRRIFIAIGSFVSELLSSIWGRLNQTSGNYDLVLLSVIYIQFNLPRS